MFSVFLENIYLRLFTVPDDVRPMIICAMPDEWGSVGTIVGSVAGIPTLGTFIYKKDRQTLSLIDYFGNCRKFHKHEFLCMPELDDLEAGIYYWIITDDKLKKLSSILTKQEYTQNVVAEIAQNDQS